MPNLVVKIPVRKNNAPFHFKPRLPGLSGFVERVVAPPLPAGNVFAGLGAFKTQVPTPYLPSGDVFYNMRSARGMGSFFIRPAAAAPLPGSNVFAQVRNARGLRGFFINPQARPPLPAPSVFGAACPKLTGMGCYKGCSGMCGRCGMGDDDSDIPASFLETSQIGGLTDTSGATVTDTSTPYVASNASLDALNQALTNYQGTASKPLTADQLGQLSQIAGSASSSVLASLTKQLQGATSALSSGTSRTAATPTTSSWLSGTSSFLGSTWNNSTLVMMALLAVGGAVVVGNLKSGRKR
jgi:hypothetical protein